MAGTKKKREINGGLRKRRVCSRRKVGEMNSVRKFRRLQNFSQLGKFPENYSPAHATLAKQKTKNCEETNL